MNYILLINRFWQVNREYPIESSGTSLYFYLLHTSNSLGWKNPFSHSDRHLALNLGLSVNTVRSAKEKLRARGLIDFKAGNSQGGRGFESITVYKLNVSNIDMNTHTFTDMNVAVFDDMNTSVNFNTNVDALSEDINKPKEIKPKETKKNNSKAFAPPTIEEVKNFIIEKKYKNVSADVFWNFYDGKDWFVGKNKMKSWKSTIAGWEARSTNTNDDAVKNNRPTNESTQLPFNRGSTYKTASVNPEKLIRELTEDIENGNIPGQY